MCAGLAVSQGTQTGKEPEDGGGLFPGRPGVCSKGVASRSSSVPRHCEQGDSPADAHTEHKETGMGTEAAGARADHGEPSSTAPPGGQPWAKPSAHRLGALSLEQRSPNGCPPAPCRAQAEGAKPPLGLRREKLESLFVFTFLSLKDKK